MQEGDNLKPKTGSGLFSQKKIIFVIVIIVAVAAGLYFKKSESSTTETDKSQKSSSVSTTKKIAIQELGVEINAPQSLKAMTYKDVTPAVKSDQPFPTMVNLELIKFSELANKCLATAFKNTYPFATLMKRTGQAPKETAQVLKQFETFYIIKLDSSVSKASGCKDPNTQQELDKLTGDLNTALEEAFKTAKTL